MGRPGRARTKVATAFCAAVLAASSCSGGAEDPLRVFAAASLSESLAALASAFEQREGVGVELTLAGSSSLARQLGDGAPADVFVSADESTMGDLRSAGVVEQGARVASNSLVLVVEPGNPEAVTGLGDLARSSLVVVLCAPAVPCGGYARDALAAAGVSPRVDSFEDDVKAVVSKIALGEGDVGVVYETDARAARGRVERVPLSHVPSPPLTDPVAHYVAAVVRESDRATLARRFVDFMLSTAGQQILGRFGFLPPPAP